MGFGLEICLFNKREPVVYIFVDEKHSSFLEIKYYGSLLCSDSISLGQLSIRTEMGGLYNQGILNGKQILRRARIVLEVPLAYE